MKNFLVIMLTLLPALFVASGQPSAAQEDEQANTMVLEGAKKPRSLQTMEKELPPHSPTVVTEQTAPVADLRDIPSISGWYAIGSGAIMPYIGLGFGGGYGSELSRSIGLPAPSQSDLGLRNQFSQGLSPNEFQMGFRIPF